MVPRATFRGSGNIVLCNEICYHIFSSSFTGFYNPLAGYSLLILDVTLFYNV
jgi:hypothetical protein